MIKKLRSLLRIIGFKRGVLSYLVLCSVLFFVMVLYALRKSEQYPPHTVIAFSISYGLVFIILLISIVVIKRRKTYQITETVKPDNDKQRSSITASRIIKIILASFATAFAMLLVSIVGLFIFDSELAKSVLTDYLPMLWLFLAALCSPWVYKKMS